MDKTQLAERIASLLNECDDLGDAEVNEETDSGSTREVLARDEDGNAYSIMVSDLF